MVLQEARRCSWPGRSWILIRRRHFPHHDHPSASKSRFRLDVADLCFPDIGTASLRKSGRPLSDSANTTSLQCDGFHPSPEVAEFLAFDSGGFLLLLLVKLCLSSLHQLMIVGGMFIPFTFIVVEAQSHGMSPRLAAYLVPILNAAR